MPDDTKGVPAGDAVPHKNSGVNAFAMKIWIWRGW
jgi:hypothetical protein